MWGKHGNDIKNKETIKKKIKKYVRFFDNNLNLEVINFIIKV